MMRFQTRALSDGFASANLSDRTFAVLCLLATGLWLFPHAAAAAQSVQLTTAPKLAFEINEKQTLLNHLQEGSSADTISRQKAQILKHYLAERNSPLADDVETLLSQPNWKLILSISHAESNMCKHQLGNNCWGIGGAEYHRFYPSFAEGIADANCLIQKYADSGLDTPKKMMYRWVGWRNNNWVIANNQVLAQLDQLGL